MTEDNSVEARGVQTQRDGSEAEYNGPKAVRVNTLRENGKLSMIHLPEQHLIGPQVFPEWATGIAIMQMLQLEEKNKAMSRGNEGRTG